MNQLFCVVVVDVEEKKAVGVDFCNDADEMLFKAKMFQDDMGEGFIVLTYPDSLVFIADAAETCLVDRVAV